MAYNLFVTKQMNSLLDEIIQYLLFEKQSKQAARHLLDMLDNVYDHLIDNPYIYNESDDLILKKLNIRQVPLREMNYILMYKIIGTNVYVMGIYNRLEDYVEKLLP